MAESISYNALAGKEEKYKELFPQIESLVCGETDRIANMANICAVLREAFGFFWVGFYLVKGDELVLGPFQGPLACTRIKFGRGVCGSAWEKGETVIVRDVEQFPGHIACSSLSRSEIVVPLISEGQVTAVLDVDSDQVGAFDPIDGEWLGRIAGLLGSYVLSYVSNSSENFYR